MSSTSATPSTTSTVTTTTNKTTQKPEPWFNLGGPGYFSDVFDIDIFLDSNKKVISKGFLFEQQIQVFRSDEKITGKITVTAPPRCTVYHNGIRIDLESSIQFYESLNSVALFPSEPNTSGVEITPAGYISNSADFKFELDLAKIKYRDLPVMESYDGQKFDVRHSILITIARPWYTFNVTRVQAIAIQTISPAPPTDDQAHVVPTQLGVVSREPKIVVDDCGGTCTLTYARSHWNIGDTLMASMEFSELLKPITVVKLILYKIEVADGDTEEKTVKELTVVGPLPTAAPTNSDSTTTPSSPTAAAAAAAVAPPPPPPPAITTTSGKIVRHEPVVGKETLNVAFVLQGDKDMVLTPTYDELNDADNTVNVHYYLRLLLETGEGDKYWNTHEIIIYRASLTGVVSDIEHV
jgi:hypothetical protein